MTFGEEKPTFCFVRYGLTFRLMNHIGEDALLVDFQLVFPPPTVQGAQISHGNTRNYICNCHIFGFYQYTVCFLGGVHNPCKQQ